MSRSDLKNRPWTQHTQMTLQHNNYFFNRPHEKNVLAPPLGTIWLIWVLLGSTWTLLGSTWALWRSTWSLSWRQD